MASATNGTEDEDDGLNVWRVDVAASKAEIEELLPRLMELEELLPRFRDAVIRATVLMTGAHGRAESNASMWQVTHERMRELADENKRLKAILAQHGIDANSAAPNSM